MARIIEIQKRSNEWLVSFGANVARVLRQNGGQMVDLNKSQMLSSMDANGGALIHKRTKSAYLSKAYAKKKGKLKPNLLDSGDFQGGMNIEIKDEKEYFIRSTDKKTEWLKYGYGKIFGIAPQNQKKAQAVNDPAIINDYLKKVFQ